jgi:hypothetical protein
MHLLPTHQRLAGLAEIRAIGTIPLANPTAGSLREIAKQPDRLKIPTKLGGPWSFSTVQRILAEAAHAVAPVGAITRRRRRRAERRHRMAMMFTTPPPRCPAWTVAAASRSFWTSATPVPMWRPMMPS